LLAGCAKPVIPPAPVTLTDFKLTGNLSNDLADFTLTATAHVEDTRGGSLDLLSGPVALTAIDTIRSPMNTSAPNKIVSSWPLTARGSYPVRVRFSAAVRQADGWNGVDFSVAPSVLQPVVLQGLAAETQFKFPGAARPDRSGNDFLSYLPASGAVKFSWKEVPRKRKANCSIPPRCCRKSTSCPA
jgi:hypothetical protein